MEKRLWLEKRKGDDRKQLESRPWHFKFASLCGWDHMIHSLKWLQSSATWPFFEGVARVPRSMLFASPKSQVWVKFKYSRWFCWTAVGRVEERNISREFWEVMKPLGLQSVVFGGKYLLILALPWRLKRWSNKPRGSSPRVAAAECPVGEVMRENVRKRAYTPWGRPSVIAGLGFGLYLGNIRFASRRREVLYKYPFVPL